MTRTDRPLMILLRQLTECLQLVYKSQIGGKRDFPWVTWLLIMGNGPNTTESFIFSEPGMPLSVVTV